MACPPEDSRGCKGMGNRTYQEFLEQVLAEKKSACKRSYRKLCAEVNTAVNYKGKSGREGLGRSVGYKTQTKSLLK